MSGGGSSIPAPRAAAPDSRTDSSVDSIGTPADTTATASGSASAGGRK